MTAVLTPSPEVCGVLAGCVSPLRRIAEYELPESLAHRMHELGERKGLLTDPERGELTALVELWRQRTLEKLEAQVALKRLGEHFPTLVDAR